jgi:hypothetical protein
VVTRVFKRSVSVNFKAVLFVSLLQALMAGCADEAALPEAAEVESPQSPPPNIVDGTAVNLEQVFVGQSGCQDNTELSLLNFDPNSPVDASACVNDETVAGSNPTLIAESDDGVALSINVNVDDESRDDYMLYSQQDTVGLLDLNNNVIRRLHSFTGNVCEISPAYRYVTELNSANQTETWHKVNEPFVFVETVESGIGSSACNSKSAFRRYFKLAINYDAFADNFSVCQDELNGMSTAADCKTRLLPTVSQAEAKAQLIKAWIDDPDSADPADKKLIYGYAGWGQDDQTLKVLDSDRAVVWEQDRTLESFDSVIVDGAEQTSEYLAQLSELEDNFYILQLGRDHFLFDASELLESITGDGVLTDRVYLAEARVDGNGDSSVVNSQFAFDEDELVVFDAGKFFRTNYKTGYSAPTSVLTYVMAPSLGDLTKASRNNNLFSQFEQGDCAFAADETECDSANDLADPAWQFVTPCTTLLGCALPVDNTDYCVLPSEATVSTTEDERCTASRFEDLNELDDPANDLAFLGFVKYSNDYIRSLSFDFYNEQLLVVVRLLEKDALLVYDIRQPLTAPKSQREKLILGERLNQAVMSSIQLNSGVFMTTLVKGSEVSNRCYRGLQEASCNLTELALEGSGAVCTGLDLQLGNCRTSKFNYESRALFCTDAQISSGQCTDDNQVNPLTADRQIESAAQDAKWLQVLKPSSTGIERSIYALISDNSAPNSVAPGESAVKDEGVLINPELYSVTLPGVTLGQRLAQMNGELESVFEAAVVRGGEASLSVVAQDFFNNGRSRKLQAHFLDESAQTLTPVSNFEFSLQ